MIDHLFLSMLPCRVWDETDRKFVAVQAICLQGSHRGEVMGENGKMYNALKDPTFRFTGVNAQDDRMIYEGDICERFCEAKECALLHRGYVAFDAKFYAFVLVWPSGNGTDRAPLVQRSEKGHMMGINLLGNIIEHPELLPKATGSV